MTSAANDKDAALALRAAAGDRTAFNSLVHLHQEPLYRFIRRYVGDADEAYDILQETLVAAWHAVARLDPRRPALAWLRRIALNKCRDWGRRRAVRKFFYGAAPLEDDRVGANSEDAQDEEAKLARLDAAIARLPAQLKEPLLLTAFEGLSQEQAGAVLGVTAKAIETRIYRARKALALILAAGESEPEA
jgi:RNA polymerase sigma-70 factor (ECF subfamily)